jgi:hypothetical protein
LKTPQFFRSASIGRSQAMLFLFPFYFFVSPTGGYAVQRGKLKIRHWVHIGTVQGLRILTFDVPAVQLRKIY